MPLDAPAQSAEVRRDRWGRYLVADPATGKEVGYSRVTTVAKALDDGGGLLPWKATLAVVGSHKRPGLAARWSALIAEHGDPWYASEASKAECKRLVEECAEAGGSSDRASLGTALHSLAERVDLAQPLEHVAESLRADLDAYRSTIAAAGVVIDVGMMEQLVVLDGPRVAGTADRLRVTLPDGRNVVADLKTGSTLDYSWQAIAVQLAAYANADARYRQLGKGGERAPMPVLDRTVGLVIHLPAGEARCELHTVDLVAGWDAFRLAVEVRKWRSQRSLSTPIKIAAPATPPKAVEQRPADVSPSPAAETSAGTFEERLAASVSALRAQIAAMSETDRRVLLERWPAGVSLRDPATLTPERVSEVEQLIAEVESFGDVESVPVVREYVERVEPWRPSVPDEGVDEAVDDVNAARVAVGRLTDEQRAWIAGIGQQSRHAGLSWHLGERATRRRVSILMALRLAAVELDCDEPSLRGLLAHIHGGDRAWASDVTLGTLVGALSAADAVQLESLIDAASDGRMSMRISADGRVEWSFAT